MPAKLNSRIKFLEIDKYLFSKKKRNNFAFKDFFLILPNHAINAKQVNKLKLINSKHLVN